MTTVDGEHCFECGRRLENGECFYCAPMPHYRESLARFGPIVTETTDRSEAQLWQTLREQLGFLQVSGAAFDAGFAAEAVRIATTVRVLIHHDWRPRGQSRALLQQLGVREEWDYFNTAPPVYGYDPTIGSRLVTTRQRSVGVASEVRTFVAPLGAFQDRSLYPLRFDDWWTEPVARAASGAVFSREDLVLQLANKEGGAHVDPDMRADIAAILSDTTSEMNRSALLASVRQIGWELQKTIETALADRREEQRFRGT